MWVHLPSSLHLVWALPETRCCAQARRKRLLTWKDESPAEDGQPAQLCEVRVLSGLGPPKQATGHSFAEQVRLLRGAHGPSQSCPATLECVREWVVRRVSQLAEA